MRSPAGPRVASPTHPLLDAHTAKFERRVLEPAPGVYVAIGYALANVILIEGPDGAVVVDTTEGRTAATEALAALRQHTDAPIRAVVLSHNHTDHVFGSQVFVDDAGGGIPVWAHEDTEAGIDRIVNVLRDAIQVRSLRMFGSTLPAERRTNDGIGPELRFDPGDLALARPTHTMRARTTIQAAGMDLELIPIPGETDDQIAVWLPDRKVLLPADDIYEAFPNLYTIRGTPPRDVRSWIDSLDAMRDLEAEVLVPAHTRPLTGAAEIAATLTAYRDGIQYVHDQTVRGMNLGKTADELAATIALPPHLATHPWLAEHYGRVPWSVRGVYMRYLGWYDGLGATLEPLPPDERARRYAAAMSAGRPLPEQVAAALRDEDWSWAAELATHWTRAEPGSRDAREALAQALDGLATGHINAPAVHWYRTRAAELRGELTVETTDPAAIPDDFLDGLPIDAFMHAISVRLKAEDALDTDMVVVFDFTDEGRTFTVHVRRGVAEVRERRAAAPDLVVTTTARVWKRVLAEKDGAGKALARGDLKLTGGLGELLRFAGLFDRG